ncbi:MAG: hypothetical protein ACXU9U_02630, partial [Parachlamydiaceae bacterium]
KEPKVFVGKDVAKPANPLTSEEVTLKHAKKGVKKIIIKKGTAKALEKVKNTFGETVSKNVGAGIKGVGLGIKLGEKLGNDPSLGEVANFAVDTALDKAGEFVIKQGSKGIAYLAFGGSVFATNTIVVVATGLLYSPPLYEKNEAQTLECIRAGGGQSCNDGTYFEKAFEKTYGIPYTPPPLDIRTQILQRLPIQTTGPTIGPHNPNLQEVKHWWR